jgi:CheY-like chemotaxis protein
MYSYIHQFYMKILIAEDNEETLQAYKDALEAREHTVTLSFDGQDCLTKYTGESDPAGLNESTSFDVVILDYKMPRMDGLEAAKKILQINPQQRIIFASGFVDETVEQSVRRLRRIIEVMRKPFSLNALIDTVEDAQVYEGLKTLMINLRYLKDGYPNEEQMKEIFDGLRKIQKNRTY